VVSDLVRRVTRLHSLTLHRCPGTLHFSAPIPSLRTLDVGSIKLTHGDTAAGSSIPAATVLLPCEGVVLSHIAPGVSVLRLQHVRCDRGTLVVEHSNHLRQVRLVECPLDSLVVRHAPMLTTITITSATRRERLSLSIEACPALRVLKLEGAWVPEGELQAIVAACPRLTELEVHLLAPSLLWD
jgi:hypothetical protein